MKQNDEMKSLNENLITEFSIKELEERLETDPMLLGNPFDASVQLDSTLNAACLTICFTCHEVFG